MVMEWTLPVERFNVWEEPSGWTTLANAALPVVQISSQGSEQDWQGLLSLVGGTLLELKDSQGRAVPRGGPFRIRGRARTDHRESCPGCHAPGQQDRLPDALQRGIGINVR